MLKTFVAKTPGVRQAMWFGEKGPLEVATDDPSFTPTEAAGQLEALRAIEHVLPLGELVFAAFGDADVSATFHQRADGLLVVVGDPDPEGLGARVLELDEQAMGTERR